MTEAEAPPVQSDRFCAYCVTAPGTEEDHVVARQFFPATGGFRDNLPKVPACSSCNRAKQRLEDSVAVWFQLGDGSPGSTGVVKERVPRTLAKNQRLLRMLRDQTREVWAPGPEGILVPSLALDLKEPQLRDAHQWFSFVVRGLYRHEVSHPLPLDHRLRLIWPSRPDQFKYLLNLLSSMPGHRHRSFAKNEFRYLAAWGEKGQLSLWLIGFRSINMASIATGPACPTLLDAALDRIAWNVT